MKRLLFFICTLLCANVIMAQSYFEEGDFEYHVTGAGEVEVYDCNESVTSVNIPSTVTHTWQHYSYSCNCYITDSVRTYSVTAIRWSTFRGCDSLTSVNIPNSVTSIGDGAFYGCSSLTSVNIPNSVTEIGGGAFYNCSSLTSVTIPNSVTSIGGSTFYGCSSLTSIDIPNSVTSIGDGAFYGCSSLTSVTIPNSVTSIGEWAFAYCSSLTSVTIPNSVTFIGYEAFYGCSSLTTLNFNAINCNDFYYTLDYQIPFSDCPISTINIGDSVQRIPNYFADNLDSLTSIIIPNSVTSIGYWAFRGCSSLTSATIGNSVTSIGNSVTSIGYRAFEDCSSLTSVTIGNSVTSIGEMAFYNCSSLTSVNIGNSVTSIGEEAFYNCDSLTSVTIPNSVTSIGESAFGGCSSLTSVTIGNSVTSIGYRAFSSCRSLTSVTIPNSVTSIGGYAFWNCSSLTTLNYNAINCNDFEDDNDLFYYYPFGDCPITTINIGDSVQRIPNNFARSLDSLTSVTIGNSVDTIGGAAFENCSSLTSITCLADIPPALGNNVFNNTPSNKILYVNCGLRNHYVLYWGNSFNLDNIEEIPFDIDTYVNNEIEGSIEIERNSCSTATLTATANNCYQFVCWNDGNIENPRIIELTNDTTFTAIFEDLPNHNYNVNVSINNDSFGSVSIENDCNSSTLTATANNCYQFVSWNDGNTENPRIVNVSSDTSFTAIFDYILFDTTINATINAGETYAEFGFNESEAGTYVQNLQTINGCDSTITLILDVNSSLMDVVDTELFFFPNPTKSEITFSQTIESIEVIDQTGRCVLTFSNAREINIESLPAGAYYLRLTNEEKAIMRKVIKE